MVFVFYNAVFKEGGGVFKCIKLSYMKRVSLFVLVFAACNYCRKWEVTEAEMARFTPHSMVVDELHDKKDDKICNHKLKLGRHVLLGELLGGIYTNSHILKFCWVSYVWRLVILKGYCICKRTVFECIKLSYMLRVYWFCFSFCCL